MLRKYTIRQLKRNHLAIGTATMTIGLGVRTVGQALMFLIVARILGISDYGAYSAILAIAGSLGCFAGLGTSFTLIREVARDKNSFGHAWHKALAAIIISFPFLLIVYLLIARLALPTEISWISLLSIGIAELALAPIAQAAANAYQGHDRMARSARLILAPTIPRLVGSLVLAVVTHAFALSLRLDLWSLLYAAASFVATMYTLRMVRQDLGPAIKPQNEKLVQGLWDGIAFAFGGAAIRLYADVDKTMLARMTTLAATGAYSAAYRVIDMALVPVASLLAVSLPTFFRAKETGPSHSLAIAGRFIRLPLLYALLASICMYSLAGLMPLFLGESFVAAVAPLRWLAWMPTLCVPRLFLQQLLIGNDHQAVAVTALTFGALINIVANLLWIPSLGWLGAVFATYIAEMFMCLTMAYLVWQKLYSSSQSIGG